MNAIGQFGQPLSVWVILLRMAVAVAIGGAIGIDREIKNRPAGMRTHVLVCVGAALVALIEYQTVACVVSLNHGEGIGVSMGRITAGVVSGVGFLGAGTIFMSKHRMSGLTTAASLWCTACIGLAAGFGFHAMAIAAGVLVLVVLRVMQRVVHVHTFKGIEVQFWHRAETLPFLNDYFAKAGIRVLDVDFHAETKPEGNLYTNIYLLSIPNSTTYVDIIGTLSEHPNVRAVRTRNV